MENRVPLTIRPEQPHEHRAVEALTREAFFNLHVPGCDEHYLAHLLRAHADFLPELDFVAYEGELLVGSIMYVKAKIELHGGGARAASVFGPLSVLPSHQKRGVGSALVRHSLEAAKAQGHEAVLIYGDPAYYGRFGFVGAEAYGIQTADGRFHKALLALELVKGALENSAGRLVESDAYSINAEAAALFDATFPYKEKLVTESQRAFARLAHGEE